MEKGSLYIVSLPIGNELDISQRALETLGKIDLIVAEENKTAKYILSKYNLKKDYFILNEHNEKRDYQFVIASLLSGENCALISDCGTPVLADPGSKLLDACYSNKIQVVPIPGASSLTSTLAVCPFDIRQFYFAGFLPKQQKSRLTTLKNLKKLNIPLVILEAPYRIINIFEDIEKIFPDRKILFVYKATMKDELVKVSFAKDILRVIKEKALKGEFVIVVDKASLQK